MHLLKSMSPGYKDYLEGEK
ncbi:hypothetical protein SEUBUCD646_0N01830 [Saccharomyces eubayanus]|uniref:Uncharacterized protein n=1 Tax=Saccharomyces eubayanus TaxID=1080349 RepID=A0ABN8VMC9_SACEU|nr:YSF3-like protein [Saccharomyces eubayanus]KOG97024.1 YSF3-like protein [Saccharomyces eubayanus]CAI1679607.1 hypothetical protein SEUBUCD650_0N01830 [Saccharomyces eubayanus]CAI1710745.1 hypothetical protein SEUBUCD646_0N01830 [Saccharomyces eubayanus]